MLAAAPSANGFLGAKGDFFLVVGELTLPVLVFHLPSSTFPLQRFSHFQAFVVTFLLRTRTLRASTCAASHRPTSGTRSSCWSTRGQGGRSTPKVRCCVIAEQTRFFFTNFNPPLPIPRRLAARCTIKPALHDAHWLVKLWAAVGLPRRGGAVCHRLGRSQAAGAVADGAFLTDEGSNRSINLHCSHLQEVDGLLSYGTPVTEATLAAPERRVVPWEKLATRCIASFL